MAKIAFLGLGQMGTPMATRLLAAGHDLTVWNRSPERAEPLAAQGADVAASPAQAATGVEFVITMLATPEALERVALGDGGLSEALRPGQLFIDMSTVGPDTVRSIADQLPDGVTMVDAPVRGSVPQATDGKLDVYVGAAEEDFARVRPILEPFGRVRHTGAPGSGAAMKLVVNLTLGASIVALGESLALGDVLALDRDTVLDVLADSPIGMAVRAKRANVQSGQYPPAFKLGLAAKDLKLVLDAAAGTGRDLRMTEAVRAWLDEAVQQGQADLDFSAIVATILGQDASKPRHGG